MIFVRKGFFTNLNVFITLLSISFNRHSSNSLGDLSAGIEINSPFLYRFHASSVLVINSLLSNLILAIFMGDWYYFVKVMVFGIFKNQRKVYIFQARYSKLSP